MRVIKSTGAARSISSADTAIASENAGIKKQIERINAVILRTSLFFCFLIFDFPFVMFFVTIRTNKGKHISHLHFIPDIRKVC